MLNGIFRLDIPFFLPVWRRVALVLVTSGWGLFEFANGAAIWGAIFVGISAIATWIFKTTDWDAVAQRDQDS